MGIGIIGLVGVERVLKMIGVGVGRMNSTGAYKLKKDNRYKTNMMGMGLLLMDGDINNDVNILL